MLIGGVVSALIGPEIHPYLVPGHRIYRLPFESLSHGFEWPLKFVGGLSSPGYHGRKLSRQHAREGAVFDGVGWTVVTARAFARQPVVNNIFVRSFCEHRPAVKACVEVFEQLSNEDIERAARDLHHALSTRALATLTRTDVLGLL